MSQELHSDESNQTEGICDFRGTEFTSAPPCVPRLPLLMTSP